MRKLTDGQKRVLQLMADGWELRKGWQSGRAFLRGAGANAAHDFEYINANTFNSLLDHKLIEMDSTTRYKPPQRYTLTDAGRTALEEADGGEDRMSDELAEFVKRTTLSQDSFTVLFQRYVLNQIEGNAYDWLSDEDTAALIFDIEKSGIVEVYEARAYLHENEWRRVLHCFITGEIYWEHIPGDVPADGVMPLQEAQFWLDQMNELRIRLEQIPGNDEAAQQEVILMIDWIAGRLSAGKREFDGGLHGIPFSMTLTPEEEAEAKAALHITLTDLEAANKDLNTIVQASALLISADAVMFGEDAPPLPKAELLADRAAINAARAVIHKYAQIYQQQFNAVRDAFAAQQQEAPTPQPWDTASKSYEVVLQLVPGSEDPHAPSEQAEVEDLASMGVFPTMHEAVLHIRALRQQNPDLPGDQCYSITEREHDSTGAIQNERLDIYKG
jgi:hypothetical protein